MNRLPIEPLDTQERELADLLGKLGPRGEPSPALDAQILASAREAVAPAAANPSSSAGSTVLRKPRRRWPALTGLAASVLFAAGIAWQLRPPEAVIPTASEAAVASESAAAADGPAGPASADIDEAVTPPTTPAQQAAPSEPAPPAKNLSPPPELSEGRPASAPLAKRATVAPQPAPVPVVTPPAPPAPVLINPPAPPAPPAPPPAFEPAPAAAPAPASIVVDAPQAFDPALAHAPASQQQAIAEAEKRAEQHRAASTSRQRISTASMQAARPQPTVTASTAERMAAPAAAPNLDSIVVSGTRIAQMDVPVSEDAKLSRSDWLKRIRQRKEQGDVEGARDSLALFVRKYPRAVIPTDLRELSKE